MSGFTLLRRIPVETLRLTVEEYRHQPTGARHLHMVFPDPHNAFLVAFLTVPSDSTGVAHILEHTALCGSERFPVRDPFFMMLRRSLATFMNAFTSSDWTAYPFASQSRKDYFNLLSVYLDAAFFPRLDELDFAQEGHRVEFARKDDPDSELVFKGVVFNEMKGALSSPGRVLWETIQSHLFPTITYHFNSGGDPVAIPDLTHEALKAFHARHYHPSNAIFMTFGDIPAAQVQERIQEQVMDRFQPLAVDFAVGDELRRHEPIRVEESYPLENENDLSRKTHITLSWLLNNGTRPDAQLEGHLLHGILFSDSAAPLLHALETSPLGNSPSPACGLDDDTREMTFSCGLEGSDPELADQVEAMILETLERVAREGISAERVESVLHQLEISRREVTGQSFPYGLKLMLQALPAALHGADPVAALDLDSALNRLREKCRDPHFVRQLVQQRLLDNPHRVRLVLRPDPNLAMTRREEEKKRLAQILAGLSEEERRAVAVRAEELEARQQREDDPELLPKVGLEDVPADLPIPQGVSRPISGIPATWYDQPTNGLVYQSVVVELPELGQEALDLLPHFTAVLSDVGSGGRDYLATQVRQTAISGGIHARVSLRSAVDSVQGHRGVMILSGKALARNHAPFSQLLRETLETARFDEGARLAELVSQMRAAMELRVTDQGHTLAMTSASSGMGPAAFMAEQWGGLTALCRIKELDARLKEEDFRGRFSEGLSSLHGALLRAPMQLLVIGEGNRFPDMTRELEECWGSWSHEADAPLFRHAEVNRQVRVGWATSTQVHFTCKAYPTVAHDHPDSAVLTVLSGVLRNGFLHRAIREKGGAYGGGASYDSESGAFRFHSYRDPRMAETLRDFDDCLSWLMETPLSFRNLEESVLGVISALDRPTSPAGEATGAFTSALHGRTPAWRRAFRKRVLGVTIPDLKRVALTHLLPQTASIAVISNRATLEANPELGLEIKEL